jgi:hypothetical protein
MALDGSAAVLKRPARFTMRPSEDMPDFVPWWEDRPFE